MITFSKLERKGHLGNQLFQIASVIGVAKANHQDFCFPKWSHNHFFKKELPIISNHEFRPYKEVQFSFEPIIFAAGNYDLEGWFQSEKYFDIDLIKDYFQFKDSLIDNLKSSYQIAFSKKTILLSIRRGDFVDHPDYFQLPIHYYLQALIHNFPDWKEKNLILLSDDIDYCKFHFSFLENAFFAHQLSAEEQLALGSLCDDFIISNSTFSWWCAWLGEKKHSTIIRPLHYFTESKNKKDNDKDYFPDRWKIFNHLNQKIALRNTTIVLRKENPIVEEYLSQYFSFVNQNKWSLLVENDIEDQTKSVLIINDVILPPFCIYNALQNNTDTIGFLKGRYLNISKYLDYTLFKRQFDFGLFTRILNQDKGRSSSKLWLFVLLSPNQKFNEDDFLKKNLDRGVFEANDFVICLSFAGKIKGFFEWKYYIAVQKRKVVVFIKKKVKNAIKAIKK